MRDKYLSAALKSLRDEKHVKRKLNIPKNSPISQQSIKLITLKCSSAFTKFMLFFYVPATHPLKIPLCLMLLSSSNVRLLKYSSCCSLSFSAGGRPLRSVIFSHAAQQFPELARTFFLINITVTTGQSRGKQIFG